MSNLLNFIVSQFTNHAETIRILYLVDEDFKSLCDDYYTSKMHSEKLHDKMLSDKQWENEYQHLSSVLEKEIIDYITNREMG